MKSFKGYLKNSQAQLLPEAAPKWTESLSTMLFDLPRAGLKDVLIPISPAILKRIWPKPPRTTVFHLTDYAGIKKLKNLINGTELNDNLKKHLLAKSDCPFWNN